MGWRVLEARLGSGIINEPLGLCRNQSLGVQLLETVHIVESVLRGGHVEVPIPVVPVHVPLEEMTSPLGSASVAGV